MASTRVYHSGERGRSVVNLDFVKIGLLLYIAIQLYAMLRALRAIRIEMETARWERGASGELRNQPK